MKAGESGQWITDVSLTGKPFLIVLRNWQSMFTRMNETRTINNAMRRTSLTPEQAHALAVLLRQQRDQLGYTIRQLATRANANLATIVRLERGDILTPQPDTLKALAAALDLPVTDLFTVADWLPEHELPTFTPYLRAKCKEFPDEAVAQMERFFNRLAKKHGVRGPAAGEDEQ
jgi:transcriptional regulator with XRE-family HTH domain